MRQGDEVLQINGQAVSDFISANHLLCADTNRASHLVLRRGDERKTVSVRLVPIAELISLRFGLGFKAVRRADCGAGWHGSGRLPGY